MKRALFVIFLILLILPSIQAINLDVNKTSSDEVLIVDLNKPAIVNVEITNHGPESSFLFYTFFGLGMYPKGSVIITPGQTKEVELGFYPREDYTQRGYVSFDYFIQSGGSEQKETLIINVIDLKDAFEIGSNQFNPDENSLKIYIKNKVNFNFDNMDVKFSSPFFDLEKSFSLAPKEEKEFDVQINKDDFKKLTSGFYTLNAEINVDETKAEVEGIIEFVEKDIVTTSEKKLGFIISTNTIEKINEGNTVSEAETVIRKNIISRLFTNFSPQPDLVERKGIRVYYTWIRDLSPGEVLEIKVRTNWFFPLLIIFFVGAIVVLARMYSKTNLVLKKKVTFVRAKGGEFALKVSLSVQARKYVERVTITDRIPPLVKLHEKFGAEKPKRINERTRKIEWDFEKLEAGEFRIMSYIIYSKVGVVGRFALPSATAIYEREGNIQETSSNKAFFLTEQTQMKEE